MHPAQSSGQGGRAQPALGSGPEESERTKLGANEKWEGNRIAVKPCKRRLCESVGCYFLDWNKASVFLMASSMEMAFF